MAGFQGLRTPSEKVIKFVGTNRLGFLKDLPILGPLSFLFDRQLLWFSSCFGVASHLIAEANGRSFLEVEVIQHAYTWSFQFFTCDVMTFAYFGNDMMYRFICLFVSDS